MTNPRQHWYLIAYDVREPRRLRRVHAYLRKRALAMQRSVFIIQTDSAGLTALEAGLRELVDARADDLRRYPIPSPATLWLAGRQGERLAGLHDGATPAPRARRLGRWLKDLLGREAA